MHRCGLLTSIAKYGLPLIFWLDGVGGVGVVAAPPPTMTLGGSSNFLCPPSGATGSFLTALTLCVTWRAAFIGGLLLVSVGPSVAVADVRVSR